MDGRIVRSLFALLLLLLPRDAGAQTALRSVSTQIDPRDAAPALPLAAGGYCVVALRDQREWVSGGPRVAAQFDGRHYTFAGPRQREIFVAKPLDYAPVLSGDCPVTVVETGERTAGKVEFGVVQGGRLYFFATAEARAKFVAAPATYADADLADGGRCIVSRVEYARDVAGLPETAVVVNGMRRLFAGAYEQRLYLQQPGRYDPASSAPPASPATTGHDEAGGSAGGGWHASSSGGSPTGESDAESAADASSAEGSPARSPAAGEPTLDSDPAMGGYCPVTLKTKGVWVRGRYDDRVRIGDLVFLTAGPAERDAFMADPTPFIPALGGDCAVSLVDFGEKIQGSTFHAADYHGRLYFFADADRKETFRAQPERYASIDLAAGGECVVTLKDEGKHTAGFSEIAVWHDGLQYRFAGPEEKAKFLAAPDTYMTTADAAADASEPAPQSSVAQ